MYMSYKISEKYQKIYGEKLQLGMEKIKNL